MSKYIIRVNTASEYPQDINGAFVDVDADLLKTIESRRRLFSLAKQEDDTLYSMRYWCGAPEFYEMDEDAEEDFQEGSMLVEDPHFTFTPQRIECVTMVVTGEGVSWTCYQKHCDVELRTDILGYVVLKETP